MVDAAQNGNLDPSGANRDVQSAAQPEDKVRLYDLIRHLIDDLALLFARNWLWRDRKFPTHSTIPKKPSPA